LVVPVADGDLRFFHLGQLVYEHSVAGPATLNTVDLESVPNDPFFPNSIGGVDVDVFSSNASHAIVPGTNLRAPGVEVDLYAEDLVATNAYLASIAVAAETPAQPFWANATSTAQMPSSVVLPYPPNQNWFLSQRYGLSPLETSDFWETATPAVPPDADNGEPAAWNPSPQHIGSVKSARIYDPGLCSQEIPFHNAAATGVFDMFDQNIVEYLAANGGSLDYSFLTTDLDDGLSFIGTRNTPRGGFFWYAWFAEINAIVNGELGQQSIELAMNTTFDFGLDDGVLTISATENQVPLTAPQIAFDEIVSKPRRNSSNQGRSRRKRRCSRPRRASTVTRQPP
jgi:hypothetical protein